MNTNEPLIDFQSPAECAKKINLSSLGSTLIRVSKQYPCPICGKHDWCSIFQDGICAICMRISAGAIKETLNGGFLHRLSNSKLPCIRTIPAKPEMPKRDDLPDIADYFHEQGKKSHHRISWLSDQLGLPLWTLNDLSVGWSERRKAFSFPMRDSKDRIIGIRLRSWAGKKYAVTGSREGLFIPKNLEKSSRILICEGPTDCAALLSIGFPVIARPNCSGGVKHIIGWIKQNNQDEVVIVSDTDEPGRRGAQSLASALCIYAPSLQVIYPPDGVRDVRAWINTGASRADVEEVIRKNHTFADIEGDF